MLSQNIRQNEMERRLFQNVEKIKNDTKTILNQLENTEILLQQYVLNVSKMRGESDDDSR